ncbi:hypothetical protein PAT3040_01823 [Paenibacillus agaridevorans]|uniref:SLH domain-containing protein n=1 Tax=Paenibacillus agaridevorans TaxID=171404 RepID=A0A2R5EMD4_9BACL|nr:S-layer homology domain-containing protein [Paenibacillus agaridevorans]GBG07275.1 hypothetical protein PAT3040_01823 [Paenibacillus agaridevorans]
MRGLKWIRIRKDLAGFLSFSLLALSLGSIQPTYAADEDLPIGNTIESNALVVELDPNYPQVITYTLKDNNGFIEGSEPQANVSDYRISINDVDYAASVTFAVESANSAEYIVTVNDVDLDGAGPLTMRAVTLKYLFMVEGTTLTKKITEITGDDASAPFRVQLKYPIMSVNDATMADTGVAVSNIGGVQSPTLGYTYNQTSDFIWTLQDMYDAYIVYNSDLFRDRHFMEQVAYAFVWNDKAVGGVYTPSSFDRPYTMRLRYNDNAAKTADIYDGVYYHRLVDGHRPQNESELGVLNEVWYESQIHIGQDSNNNGQVDWQDGALWIREQIPQMPEVLREFFNGGNWHQTHGAFPGPGGLSSTFKGFTVVNSSLDHLEEAQRQTFNMTDGVGKQSYEYVGWNGRGHDYGWPSINEIYYNPALGTDAKMAEAKSAMEVYGGDLSFHVNMTDMTTNSNAYLRGNTPHIYGNAEIATDGLQYGTTVFGWDAYQISHYADVKAGYPFNRQDDFVDRFWSPLIIYQDVMIDYPKGEYGKAEERYAKKREIDHWAALGTYAATEYYDAEKRLNGGYIFKVENRAPAVLDSFINAGKTVFHSTRTYQTQPQDYIWGTIYSDTERNGNVNIGYDQNRSAIALTKMTFLYSLLNGYLAQYGIQEYEDTETRTYTRWGDNVIYEYDKATQKITVTNDDVVIARGTDRFIPAFDGTDRIFVYGVEAGHANTWKLPEGWGSYSTLDLFELTSEGRSYVDTIYVNSGQVTLNTKALTGYVLVPSNNNNREVIHGTNLSLHAKVTASSHTEDGYNSTTQSYTGTEFRTITNENAPDGDWTTVLKDMTSTMIDSQGTITYQAVVLGAFTADGVQSSYWTPNINTSVGSVDLADGEAWVEYDLGEYSPINKFVIQEVGADGDKVTSFRIDYFSAPWGKFLPLYSGTNIPLTVIETDTVFTNKIRLVITGAESNSPKISEFEIYGAEQYTRDFNDNLEDDLQIVKGNQLSQLVVSNGELQIQGGEFLAIDNNSPMVEDGIYSFKMKFTGSGGAGAVLRYASPESYTWIGFQSGGAVRMRTFNEDLEEWVERSFSASNTGDGEWHQIDIEYIDQNVWIRIDNIDVYYGELTHPGQEQPILAGKTGFTVWGDAEAAFDNASISISNPESNPVSAIEAQAIIGSTTGSTAIQAAVDAGNRLVLKLSERSMSVPNAGDLAPVGAGITDPYLSGTDISDVSAGVYVGVYEVDSSNQVAGFKLLQLTKENIKAAPVPAKELSATVSQGNAVQTSKVEAVARLGNQLVIQLSSDSIVVPYIGDLAPAGAGVIQSYTSGADISGVSAGQYIGVYEVNSSNQVLGFKLLQLTIDDIKPTPAPELAATVAQGSAMGTSRFNAVVAAGNKLVIQFSFHPIVTPFIGNPAPIGAGVTNPYTSGANLFGVSAGMYVGVYEVDNNNQVLGFKLLQLAEGDIRTTPEPTATPCPTSTPGPTAIPRPTATPGPTPTPTPTSTATVPTTPTLTATPTHAQSFSDVAGHWAEAGIQDAINRGIVTGYSDRTFKPKQQVTRTEFTVMLMRGLKLESQGTSIFFSDASAIAAWAEQAITQAVEAGLISGYEDNTFRPNAIMTRLEMAVIAAKALGLSLEAVSTMGFADDQDIPAWGKAAVAAAKQAGIMKGQLDNRFNPNGLATRAEALTVILRLLDAQVE